MEARGTSPDATLARFYDAAPEDVLPNGTRRWFTRAQDFVVVYTEAEVGELITRAAQPDEYVLLVPDEATSLIVEWEGTERAVVGHSISFVPPGCSRVRVTQPGRVVLFFTTASEDLRSRCMNATAYRDAGSRVDGRRHWPAAVGDPRVRSHSLAAPDSAGRFGRIWRCSSFMLNVFPPQMGRRDTTRLSPHSHDSFEQGSLVLQGRYVHHLRWPWTCNLAEWRPDREEACGAPSLLIIPASVVHTSRAVGSGENLLVDIFSPPRMDFSRQPGWVLNHDEYPLGDT